MSHSFVMVILPKKTKIEDAEKAVDKILKPFNENKRVKGYQRPCYCIGQEARTEVSALTDLQFSSWESLRKDFYDQEKIKELSKIDPFSDEIDVEWQTFTKARAEAEREAFENHPNKLSPKKDCGSCKGEGTYKSTYNPKAKWDWYSIGGRWNGVIKGQYRGDETGFNFGDEYRQLDENITTTDNILQAIQTWEANGQKKDENPYPFALVDPKKVWHEKGSMGYWGMVSNEKEKDSWHTEVKQTLIENPGCFVVGMDLHI